MMFRNKYSIEVWWFSGTSTALRCDDVQEQVQHWGVMMFRHKYSIEVWWFSGTSTALRWVWWCSGTSTALRCDDFQAQVQHWGVMMFRNKYSIEVWRCSKCGFNNYFLKIWTEFFWLRIRSNDRMLCKGHGVSIKKARRNWEDLNSIKIRGFSAIPFLNFELFLYVDSHLHRRATTLSNLFIFLIV